MRKIVLLGTMVIGVAFLSASPISVNWSAAQKTLTVSEDRAVAAVGKPLSAGSVAGVHRRQERVGTKLLPRSELKERTSDRCTVRATGSQRWPNLQHEAADRRVIAQRIYDALCDCYPDKYIALNSAK